MVLVIVVWVLNRHLLAIASLTCHLPWESIPLYRACRDAPLPVFHRHYKPWPPTGYPGGVWLSLLSSQHLLVFSDFKTRLQKKGSQDGCLRMDGFKYYAQKVLSVLPYTVRSKIRLTSWDCFFFFVFSHIICFWSFGTILGPSLTGVFRTQVALKWDKAFQGRADASGRAVAGVHVQAVGMVNKTRWWFHFF